VLRIGSRTWFIRSRTWLRVGIRTRFRIGSCTWFIGRRTWFRKELGQG